MKTGPIYLYTEGQRDSYSISGAFWQEVADEVVRLNAIRVLIDENIIEGSSVEDVFGWPPRSRKWGLAGLE